MNPKDRLRKAAALNKIADTVEQMEGSGANKVQVGAFVTGARKKLAEELPDPEKYADAAASAAKWARTNINF